MASITPATAHKDPAANQGGSTLAVTATMQKEKENAIVNKESAAVDNKTAAEGVKGGQNDAAAAQAEAAAPMLDAAALAVHVRTLEEIEMQCTSHGRHPAEWDGVNECWIEGNVDAVPYFVLSETLMKPTRPREVVCELLAAGVPLQPDAHCSINNVYDVKAFVRKAKKLVAAARSVSQFPYYVATAKETGAVTEQTADYIMAAQAAVSQVSAALGPEALEAVEKKFPKIAGSMTLASLDNWLESMSLSRHAEVLKAHTQRGKLVSKAVSSKQQAIVGATMSKEMEMGAIAEKVAQFLAGFYHQEVKAARGRRLSGAPPRLVREPTPEPADVEEGAPAPESMVGGSINGVSAALLALLPRIPERAQWGYKTAAGLFIPVDFATGTTRKPVRLRAENHSSGQIHPEDTELKELAVLYKPVLWMPTKNDTARRAWELYLREKPGAERTDANVKEATAQQNANAVKELRCERFALEEVRQMIREVGLMVQHRIIKQLLVPAGTVQKANDTLKAKLASLDLPRRDPSLPDPALYLLQLGGSPEQDGGGGEPSDKRRRIA